jgi:hypothetical protein
MTKQEITAATKEIEAMRTKSAELQADHARALLNDADGTAKPTTKMGHWDWVRVVVDAGGIKIAVDVVDATFGDEKRRFETQVEANAWLASKRAEWKKANEAASIRAGFNALVEKEIARLAQLLDYVGDASSVTERSRICVREAMCQLRNSIN